MTGVRDHGKEKNERHDFYSPPSFMPKILARERERERERERD